MNSFVNPIKIEIVTEKTTNFFNKKSGENTTINTIWLDVIYA